MTMTFSELQTKEFLCVIPKGDYSQYETETLLDSRWLDPGVHAELYAKEIPIVKIIGVGSYGSRVYDKVLVETRGRKDSVLECRVGATVYVVRVEVDR